MAKYKYDGKTTQIFHESGEVFASFDCSPQERVKRVIDFSIDNMSKLASQYVDFEVATASMYDSVTPESVLDMSNKLVKMYDGYISSQDKFLMALYNEYNIMAIIKVYADCNLDGVKVDIDVNGDTDDKFGNRKNYLSITVGDYHLYSESRYNHFGPETPYLVLLKKNGETLFAINRKKPVGYKQVSDEERAKRSVYDW